MAKKGRPKHKKGKKLSRFSLTRRGELVLASVGAAVLVGAGVFLWFLLAPHFFRKSTEAAEQERREAAVQESRWQALEREGVVIRAVQDQQVLLVDAAKWQALLPTRWTESAEAAARHFGWGRCFVDDAATGRRLGFYTPGDGYRAVAR